jgi:hypothetical protein
MDTLRHGMPVFISSHADYPHRRPRKTPSGCILIGVVAFQQALIMWRATSQFHIRHNPPSFKPPAFRAARIKPVSQQVSSFPGALLMLMNNSESLQDVGLIKVQPW